MFTKEIKTLKNSKKYDISISYFLFNRKNQFFLLNKKLQSLLPLRFPHFIRKLKSARTKSDQGRFVLYVQ